MENDENKEYKAKSNARIRRENKLGTYETELKVERMRWERSQLRHPAENAQLRTALFGRFSFEDTPTLNAEGQLFIGANPWARQWVQDVQQMYPPLRKSHVCEPPPAHVSEQTLLGEVLHASVADRFALLLSEPWPRACDIPRLRGPQYL